MSVPAVLAAVAFVNPGVPVTDVDLNDGGVWLTKAATGQLGRYNVPIKELNDGIQPGESSVDVRQDGANVLLVTSSSIAVVDPASVQAGSSVPIPAKADVSMHAGIVAVTDTDSGDTWVRTMRTIEGLRIDADQPDIALGAGGRSTVATDGTVLALAADGTVSAITVKGETPNVATKGSLPQPIDASAVAAVGDSLFALADGTLYGVGHSVPLDKYGNEFALQQTGPASETVLVSTPVALLRVNVASGTVTAVDSGGSGNPAAPVFLDGCAHAAWASATSNYVFACEGHTPEPQTLEDMSEADNLTFRVNRGFVVLNDTASGAVWLPTVDTEKRKPNWEDLIDDEQDQKDDPSDDQVQQNLQTECTPASGSPTATDDEFGVRPGRTRILPVLDNDVSSDCGVLAISEFEQLPDSFGTLSLVSDGRALQVAVAADAVGTATFTYAIADGRGSSPPDTATVTLTVRGPGENGAPVQLRTPTFVVEQGASTSANVLPNFSDPDGDDLLLQSATADAGQVHVRPDGDVTYDALGVDLGRQVVRVVVSDGYLTTEGDVYFDVRAPGSTTPVVDPIFATAYVGESITLSPLDYVRSTTIERPRLTGVEQPSGTQVAADLSNGTFTFSAPIAANYYVTYTVAAGSQEAQGLARIEVKDRPDQTPPPVAGVDIAYLPPGGEVVVDALANDVDPSGQVLVLQSLSVPGDVGLKAAIIDHRFVRITSTRVLEAPTVIGYVISNGSAEAHGEIHVLPVPAAVSQPPIVKDIDVGVRTGGVVTIPALDYAVDPDGEQLSLSRELPTTLGENDGLLFVSGNNLRYQAPEQPCTVHATFIVEDASGNRVAGQLTVRVHASDAATKKPPTPKDLIARVFEAETVRIPIPLDGIDADGSGVSLLGQDQAPSKGRITEVGADYLVYQALPGELGTDVFTYAVEDWAGNRAVAKISVGIAHRPATVASVVARDDAVAIRPGQKVEVRVLRNDVDLNGGELTLSPTLDMAGDVNATVADKRIVVQAPDKPVTWLIGYTAINDLGGQDTATLTVTVADDAPIEAPIVKDVVVPAKDTINKTTVDVDVMSTAENPSGPLSDLEVSVHPSAASFARVLSNGKIRVTLQQEAVTFPFLVTNTRPEADGVSTYAFITVPALGDFPPILRPKVQAIKVLTGQEVAIKLDEYVQVAPGKTPKITDASTVTATKSNGAALVKTGDLTTLYFSSQPAYVGPASISFEVTDGTGAGDANARTSRLSLDITVYSDEEYPPTFRPAVIQVGAGDPERTIDLSAFVSDPAATGAKPTYKFALASPAPSGFTASITGSMLHVSAAAGTRGSTGVLDLTIGYGAGGSTALAKLPVEAIASTLRKAQVRDFSVPASAGKSVSIDVLEGAVNPFPDKPLSVESATVDVPSAGTATVRGTAVEVTPAASFTGVMTVRFLVADATGDTDRMVQGTITVTVSSKPDTPGTPRVAEVRDRAVLLAWDPPASHGSPITSYEVMVQPGGSRSCGAATSCLIDNLSYDTAYTFSVRARNDVDWSDWSATASYTLPPPKPGAVEAPSVTWGDGSITASWMAPPPPAGAGPGATAERYVVEITPAAPAGSTVTVTATSYTFTGLTNGTSYQVRVQAQNRSGDAGDWSPRSDPVAPAGIPGVPTVSATQAGNTFNVSWVPGAANSDSQTFTLTVSDGSKTVHEIGPTTKTAETVGGIVNGRTYTFSVVASNKAGSSPAGTASALAYGPPSAPAITSVLGSTVTDRRPTGKGAITVTWTAPTDTGGFPISSYRVTANGSKTFTTTTSGTSVTFNDVSAGNYTVTVIAINEKTEGPAASASVDVFTGPGPIPSVRAERSGGQVIVSWDPITDAGGLPLSEVTYKYRYRFGPTATWFDWMTWTGVPTTIDTDTAMEVEVFAQTAAGDGPVATATAPAG